MGDFASKLKNINSILWALSALKFTKANSIIDKDNALSELEKRDVIKETNGLFQSLLVNNEKVSL